MENQYVEPIAELLRQVGLTEQITWQTQAIVLAGILLLSWLTAVLFRRLVIPALQKISSQTRVTWTTTCSRTRSCTTSAGCCLR